MVTCFDNNRRLVCMGQKYGVLDPCSAFIVKPLFDSLHGL